MSFNLKHVPCPQGEACQAFKCLFSHPGEDVQDLAAASAQGQRKRPRRGDDASSPDHDEPSKRAKIDRAAPNKADAKTDDNGPCHDLPNPNEPSREAETTAEPAASTAARGTRPPTNFSTRLTSKDGQARKRAGVESLNPRLLNGSPASHETRLKLIKMLHKEYTRLNAELQKDASAEDRKFAMSDQELVAKVLDREEKTATERAAVYANVMKNTVMHYKRMPVAQWKTERADELRPADAGLGRRDDPARISTGLSPVQELAMLKHLLTPICDLAKHGYVPEVPSEEGIRAVREALVAAGGWEKCDRCQQRFQVFPGRREEDGALTSGGACKFHWGKKYIPEKAPGSQSRPPKRFRCCGEEEGESLGCATHDHHVYKADDVKRLATVLNFVETPENATAPADRAICFDCEMGYTVNGMELVRLTATSWPAGEALLDVLVQPKGEILDLNSRFSGVWPDDLALAELWTGEGIPPPSGGANKKLSKVSSPVAARDLLFSLISPTTPLIGHGLENDLNACRIVHPTLVDTALLYPHRGGLPYRRALKALVEEHLGRKIQEDAGPKTVGHDSAEDARAAGDLVLVAVKREWKLMMGNGWTIDDYGLCPPAARSH